MTAADNRRKARYFLTLAQQVSLAEDRVAMLTIAAFWMERAEELERGKRIQQTQPEKELS